MPGTVGVNTLPTKVTPLNVPPGLFGLTVIDFVPKQTNVSLTVNAALKTLLTTINRVNESVQPFNETTYLTG